MSRQRNRARGWLAFTFAGVLLAVSLLRAFPPETAAFYPACPFHVWTGLLCPGCGGTRALAALAHGNLAEAMRWNPLAVVAVAICAGWLATAYRRAMLDRKPVWPQPPRPAVLTAVACAAVFAVARNLR